MHFSRALRALVLHLLFCHLAVLNILDVISGALISILFVTDDSWLVADLFCRFTVALGEVRFLFIAFNSAFSFNISGGSQKNLHFTSDPLRLFLGQINFTRKLLDNGSTGEWPTLPGFSKARSLLLRGLGIRTAPSAFWNLSSPSCHSILFFNLMRK